MLSRLELKNFRSHSHLALSFSPQTNVIIGANGAGKTNILESILIAAIGKPYRGRDGDLVSYQSNQLKIEALFDQKKRVVEIKKHEQLFQKTFLVNNKLAKRLSFQNQLPIVLFEPEFTQLLVRGPDWRRDYLDTILARTTANYQPIMNKYRRVLAQRNALLKNHLGEDQLFAWDVSLSDLGARIIAARLELLQKINVSVSEIYSDLASKKHSIELFYVSKINLKNYANNLLAGLQKNLVQDKERGFTSLGPHRDDISFSINGQDASLYASRGESRTLLLSLKIVELGLVETARGRKPILLLDDVFSELDEARQAKLIDYFKCNQVVITTTTITPLMKGISGKIIEL